MEDFTVRRYVIYDIYPEGTMDNEMKFCAVSHLLPRLGRRYDMGKIKLSSAVMQWMMDLSARV